MHGKRIVKRQKGKIDRNLYDDDCPKERNGQSGFTWEVELPFLPHYGNVRIVDSRWELRIGESYPATPTIIFGKAHKSSHPSCALYPLEHG